MDDNNRPAPAGEVDQYVNPEIDATNEIQTLRRSVKTNKGIPSDRFICAYKVEHTSDGWTVCMGWDDVKLKWKKIADDEINSLQRKEIWKITTLKRAIDCKWVFKSKQDENGIVNRCKARLVARGFTQKPDKDYEETFAPVASSTTLRILLFIAAKKKLK